MLSKKEKIELKELTLLETGKDDAGILELSKNMALQSDLHINKVSRVRELIEKL